jgi:Bacterial regulatory proteins, gntR family
MPERNLADRLGISRNTANRAIKELLTFGFIEVTRGASFAGKRIAAAAKAKFILATDGFVLEAEDLNSGETIACDYAEFADHFGFFLPLAGISTVRQLKDNLIDIKATGRLNKLYIELLKDNPDWATDAISREGHSAHLSRSLRSDSVL